MNKIIRYNSVDKDIAAVKCYVSEGLNGSPLYRDEAKTEIIPVEEAKELFEKGLITVDFGSEDVFMSLRPVMITNAEMDDLDFDEEAGYGVVFYPSLNSAGGSPSIETMIYIFDEDRETNSYVNTSAPDFDYLKSIFDDDTSIINAKAVINNHDGSASIVKLNVSIVENGEACMYAIVQESLIRIEHTKADGSVSLSITDLSKGD